MDDAEPLSARAIRLASESFLAGSGPGGQNANKVATEVELRVNIYALRLPPPVFARLRKLAGAKLAGNGDLIVTEQQLRHLAATATSIEAFRHGVDELLGAAWDADLEVYRHAGDGSPVTWLHQVV